MTITLHNLGGKGRQKKRLGRGNASGHGTYCSRGMKGQRSRSGGKGGLKLKGFKKALLNLPKYKGMKRRYPNNQVVKLSVLEQLFDVNSKINPGTLFEKGLISKLEMPVKILADQEIKKSFNFFGCLLSKKAEEFIVKAGGSVVKIEEKTKEEKKDKK